MSQSTKVSSQSGVWGLGFGVWGLGNIKENQRKMGLEDKSIKRFEANDEGVKQQK